MPIPGDHMEEKQGQKLKNQVCADCMKWDRFGEGCRVFWEGKKVCTMKVMTPEDWDMEMMLLKH
jgi:hypothetical protein